MLARKGERILFTNDLAFNYFIGDESEQFSFVKVPKLFFTDARFEELSYGAKILYGLLLDRMGLSKKNKWIDKDKRVYVIYTIDEIKEDFKVSKTVAVKFMRELEDFGLIEKKRRPNEAALIYVKNFVLAADEKENYSEEPQKQGSPESGSPEVQKGEVQKVEVQKTPDMQGSPENGSPEIRSPEVQNMESNKTNRYNYINNISSSSNKNRDDDVVHAIRDQITYEKITDSGKYDSELVDKVIQCIANVFLLPKSRYKIDNCQIPTVEIQKRIIEKLSERSFTQVLDNISANGSATIYNMQNYVTACFYKLQTIPQNTAKGLKSPMAFNGFQNQHDYDFDKLEKELLKIR